VVLELADETAVRELAPDPKAMTRATSMTGATGVGVFARWPYRLYALVVRAFVPAEGIPEDPVTGSANAAITAWMHANCVLPAPPGRRAHDGTRIPPVIGTAGSGRARPHPCRRSMPACRRLRVSAHLP
jgi:PhzF family phenazine biosynthesis protein